MKWPLLGIVGPTAVGKTDISIRVAKRLDGEIISGDSMQIYRYMDIGTAKPSFQERKEVPHHLIDVLEPHESFSVADFQREVSRLIPEIASRNRLPMLVGGTGLYLKAVIDQYDFGESKANWDLRKKLRLQAERWGSGELYEKMKKVDPVSAEKIHPHDQKRIIRALEVYYTTGKPISSQKKKPAGERIQLNPLLVGLTMDRLKLYARIEERVDKMIQEGLEDEVRGLLKRGYKPDLISMQGLGYRHMVEYIQGGYNRVEMLESLKRDTRRFAKRQLTLFQRDQRIIWIDRGKYHQEEEIVEKICQLAGKTNLTSKLS